MSELGVGSCHLRSQQGGTSSRVGRKSRDFHPSYRRALQLTMFFGDRAKLRSAIECDDRQVSLAFEVRHTEREAIHALASSSERIERAWLNAGANVCWR